MSTFERRDGGRHGAILAVLRTLSHPALRARAGPTAQVSPARVLAARVCSASSAPCYPGLLPWQGRFVPQSMQVAVSHVPGPNVPQKLTHSARWAAQSGVGPVQSNVAALVHGVCPLPQVHAIRTPCGPQLGNVVVVVVVISVLSSSPATTTSKLPFAVQSGVPSFTLKRNSAVVLPTGTASAPAPFV